MNLRKLLAVMGLVASSFGMVAISLNLADGALVLGVLLLQGPTPQAGILLLVLVGLSLLLPQALVIIPGRMAVVF
jgi:hypothetical protein